MKGHSMRKRIVLPGGGIEFLHGCGCGSIHRDGVARYYLCRGHGGTRWEKTSRVDTSRHECGCGEVHRWAEEVTS